MLRQVFVRCCSECFELCMCTDRVSKKQCSGKVTHEIHVAELKLIAAIQPLHAAKTAWHNHCSGRVAG